MESKEKNPIKKTGIVSKKKGGVNIAFRPEQIIEAKQELSVHQQDIMDFVFAAVAEPSDDDNNFSYELEVRGMKQTYGDKWNEKRYSQLKKAVKGMEGKGFYIKQGKDEIFYPWFSKIHYHAVDKNDEDNSRITIDLHHDVKRMILEAKNGLFYDNRLSIKIRNASSRDFYYLISNYYNKNYKYGRDVWYVPVEYLREKIHLPASYSNGMINSRILPSIKKELDEVADYTFDFTKVEERSPKGQKVISAFEIKIKYKEKKKEVIIENVNNEQSNKEYIKEDYIKILKDNLDCKDKDYEAILEAASKNGYLDNGIEELLKLVDYAKEKNIETNLVGYILTIINKKVTL